MNARTPTRTLLLLLAAATAAAQTPTPPAPRPVHKPRPKTKAYQPPYNPNVIVLDPAHGGQDNGAKLGSAGDEKDLNAAFAERLRALLAAQNFTVVLTHAAASDDTTPDQRVELANRSRAVACLLLHATNSGHGVHIFASSLTAPSAAGDTQPDSYIAPWDSAQAAALPKSLQLANELATALNGLKVPLVVSRASVSPVDSMSCPAVAIEIAPAAGHSSVADETYQQRLAQSIVTALTYWRQHAQDQIAAAQAAALGTPPAGAPGTAPGAPATPAPKPRPKPKPVLITAPDESPLVPDTTPKPAPKPAPIERRPPDTTTPPPGAQP